MSGDQRRSSSDVAPGRGTLAAPAPDGLAPGKRTAVEATPRKATGGTTAAPVAQKRVPGKRPVPHLKQARRGAEAEQAVRVGGDTLAETSVTAKRETRKQTYSRGGTTITTDEEQNSADKDGLHARTGHKEVRKQGDVSISDGTEHGMDVNLHGGKVSREHTTEAAIGGEKRSSTRGQSFSVGEEGAEVELEGKHRTEHADGTVTESQRSASVGAGKDGVRGQLGGKTTDAAGNQHGASVSAEVGASHVELGASVSSNPKDGMKTSVGGHVKFGKDGTEIGADVGFGKSKFSFSGGYQVEADDPIAIEGGKFAVNYKVTTTGGGSVGYSGANFGASLGGSTAAFATGTRVFDSKDAAERFQQSAAAHLPELDQRDPLSADGAMAMKVGESRGVGAQSGWNAGASGGMDGASVELSGGKQHTHGVSIERVSKDEVEVTRSFGSGSALGLGAGGFGFSQSDGSNSAKEVSMTARFDLTDPDQKAEFARYVRSPLPFMPKHGKIVGSADFDSGTDTEGTGMYGIGNAGYDSRHSKSQVTDERGTRTDYVGDASQHADASDSDEEENLAKELGISVEELEKREDSLSDHRHADLRMTARVEDGNYANDYDYGDKAEFQIEGSVSGPGEWNWQHLYEMTGLDTENIRADQAGDIASSGHWKISAGIRAIDMLSFAKKIMHDPDLTAGPVYELQQQLRVAAKADGGSPESVTRIITEYFAAQGPDALTLMNDLIYNNRDDSHDAIYDKDKYRKNESLDRTDALQWDVELEGDKNFPGAPGRMAIEQKLEAYSAAVSNGAVAPAIAAGATEDLKRLRERRVAVADLAEYRDLPIGLKRREVTKIDAAIEKLETVRHAAAVMHTAQAHDEAEPADPALVELRELRKKIVAIDAEIKELPMTKAGRGVEQAVDELRQQFLMAKPETAIVLGKALLAQLEVQRAVLQNN